MNTQGCRDFTLSLPPISFKVVLTENDFFGELKREVKRATRGKRPLSLILIEINTAGGRNTSIPKAISKTIQTTIRITEICGVLKNDTVTGIVIPTECKKKEAETAVQLVKKRILENLKSLGEQQLTDSVNLSCYVVLPEDMENFFDSLYAKYRTRPAVEISRGARTEEEYQPHFEYPR